MILVKKCNKCNKEFSLSSFPKDKRVACGFGHICKDCNKKYSKKYYAKNKELFLENNKTYRKNNKETISKRDKKYRENNKEKIKQIKKEYYQKNKETISKKQKIYNQNHKEKLKKWRKEYGKEYRNENKDNIREWNKQYKKNKRKTNPLFRFTNSLRERIRVAFKQNFDTNKTNKTFNIIGLSPKETKEYIESKFQQGMTWENYNYYGWHVDHIIPLCTAKTEEELEKLCHYTNLQPLWRQDNQSKSRREI